MCWGSGVSLSLSVRYLFVKGLSNCMAAVLEPLLWGEKSERAEKTARDGIAGIGWGGRAVEKRWRWGIVRISEPSNGPWGAFCPRAWWQEEVKRWKSRRMCGISWKVCPFIPVLPSAHPFRVVAINYGKINLNREVWLIDDRLIIIINNPR